MCDMAEDTEEYREWAAARIKANKVFLPNCGI